MQPLNELSLTEARAALDNGTITSEQLTKDCVTKAKGLNGSLNALIELYETEALTQARDADERRKQGNSAGVLDGIPLVLKDNILNQGHVVSAGSKMLANHISASDATVTHKLKNQGAIILGRANMDEFAMGSSNERSAYGPTRHPRDPERVPGGSSGGSAVAVAADFTIAALGSDTGGSIRQPAAFCGIVGFKPTFGRVSRSGLIAMASSLDQIGPMTKTVKDAAILFDAIQGPDVLDQTTAKTTPFIAAWKKDLKGVRIGLPRQAWGEGMQPGVRTRVTEAIDVLKNLGAEIIEIDLPYVEEALAVYYVLMPCEVSANLSRLDGMRYGLRLENLPLFETYAQSRAAGFGPEVKRRILLGTYALSRGYYEAYYLQAKKVQTLIRKAYVKAFETVDVLLTPTAPTTAFKIGEKTADPLTMYLEDIFTVGVNVAGLPAISVPCGNSPDNGLPVGLHLTARAFDEANLLAIADCYEMASK
ncbi:Asp-tRNA(Asn)/Glu-tRNA(Gln) amidotransferase subunit GatA [Candidatus Uhrbacteria bacterium]|nr:Asp-tRNA(Asn)/Glu-tRNA(Gln) amidotransferase subunit GatA [Candidatus Uhrbacteria bacterium]